MRGSLASSSRPSTRRELPAQREVAENGGCLRRKHLELLGDRLLERGTAPVEDARELAGATAGDEQRRGLVADRDDDGRRAAGGALDTGLDKRAQQSQSLEVDPGELETGPLGDLDVGRDLVARRDDEQDAADGLTRLRDPLFEDAVVEHGVADRDRQHLVRLEADGVVEAGFVVDARDLERADADAVGRDPDADVTGRKLLVGEEAA